MIGKCRENFNTIETTTGVSLKVHDNKFYIKAESEKSEKLAVRKIRELAVGIFGLKNSAKLRNSYKNVRNDMGKLVRRLHYTRTVRILNDTFFPAWFTQFKAFSNRSTFLTRIWLMGNHALFGDATVIASTMERIRSLYAGKVSVTNKTRTISIRIMRPMNM